MELRVMFPSTLIIRLHIQLVLAMSVIANQPRCRTTCSNHSIRFPFGIDNGCGSPHLPMICVNDSILQIVVDSKPFFVDEIDYTHSTLLLRDPSMSNCRSVNSNSAGFDLNLDGTGLTLRQGSTVLLLNCLSFAQEINFLNDQYDCHNPTCLAFLGSCHTNELLTSCCRVTYPHNRINLFPMQCMSYTSIYSPENPIFNPPSWSYGIEVQWSLPSETNDACNKCEARNGICGFNVEEPNHPFMCICESSLGCKDCILGSCTGRRIRKLIVGFSLAGTLMLSACAILVLFLRHRNRFKKLRYGLSTDILHYGEIEDKHTGMELAHVLATTTGPLPLTIFSYKELEHATAAFSETQMIGDGAYGMVYKAKFYDGRVLAVKRLNHQHHRQLQQFYNEIRILSQLRHPNLVQLEGFCLQGRNLLLVYEYICNGTVEDHLHGEDGIRAARLPWEKRLNIACDVADALAYLHFSISPPIYHRDVKSSNILLDQHMKAKVADFGLSRLVPVDATHVSTGPQGTPGYVDPEYHECYQVSDKSDVYSFGVVLLEMLTGKRAVDLNRPRNEINLSAYAIAKIQGNALHEILDPRIFSAGRQRQAATQVANLAFSCVALPREARPTMKEVAAQLHLIRSAPFKTP
ncbi:hypothetical protein KP509_16G074900 [Ceratopteris richardii]|uniref:Protein kinase domain-containing protein n=1 Tax=Ceratopteris richardii TaxID=49495 RepID=A0A8T2T1Y3_CERRI|nr:hypothetical protein KP509_16G074900 [Ceratopteris richardii]